MIKTPDGQPLEPQFDWYQATSKTDPRTLLEVLEPFTQDHPLTPDSPKDKGYACALKTGGRGGSLLIQYGGRNGDDHGPNFKATGPYAIPVSAVVRDAGLPHRVGRADVRIDFLADFEQCRLQFIDRCDKSNMHPTDRGSCPESKTQLGRTIYGGSTKSVYQPTLYEKGRQLGDGG